VVDEGRGEGYGLSEMAGDQVDVGAFYLDRDCITNADYARFVNAGGYERPECWPQDTLPWVLQFVDRTGHAGPRYWCDGKPPEDKLDHPVVGICWYEANAYARWAGKKLPSSAQWQRAGTWPQNQPGAPEQRYPWGNAFDTTKVNLWKNDQCKTITVDSLNSGATPNRIRQLIGNVWEWIDAQYCPASEGEVRLVLESTMAEVRGGAFDTYFASQATCQFRTGQPILNRPANVGFRCCIGMNEVQPPTDTIDTYEDVK
jgi:iron(II)-dependent oxidoreductase